MRPSLLAWYATCRDPLKGDNRMSSIDCFFEPPFAKEVACQIAGRLLPHAHTKLSEQAHGGSVDGSVM
jgi:hypothetical protein